MRLIIATDEITDELKRIVSYLNSHTTTNVELLALEMRRAVDEAVEVLLPANMERRALARKSGPVAVSASAARRCSPAFARRARWPATPRKASSTGPRPTERSLHGYRCRIGRTAATRSSGSPRGGQIQVHLRTLANHGERDERRVERLVQELADIGVNLEPAARAAGGP